MFFFFKNVFLRNFMSCKFKFLSSCLKIQISEYFKFLFVWTVAKIVGRLVWNCAK